jgi:hypothetical protein
MKRQRIDPLRYWLSLIGYQLEDWEWHRFHGISRLGAAPAEIRRSFYGVFDYDYYYPSRYRTKDALREGIRTVYELAGPGMGMKVQLHAEMWLKHIGMTSLYYEPDLIAGWVKSGNHRKYRMLWKRPK